MKSETNSHLLNQHTTLPPLTLNGRHSRKCTKAIKEAQSITFTISKN